MRINAENSPGSTENLELYLGVSSRLKKNRLLLCSLSCSITDKNIIEFASYSWSRNRKKLSLHVVFNVHKCPKQEVPNIFLKWL